MKRSLLLLFVAASGACAEIQTTEMFTDVQRYTAVEVDPKKTPGTVAANCVVDETKLFCSFAQDFTCSENTVEYSQQQRTVEKKLSGTDKAYQILGYIAGPILIGTGIGFVATAENFPTAEEAEQQAEMDTDVEAWDQETSQILGTSAIVIGTGLLAIGVINSIRATDKREVLPLESEQIGTREVECGNSFLPNAPFEIRQDRYSSPVSYFGDEDFSSVNNDPRISKIHSEEVYSTTSDTNGKTSILERISKLPQQDNDAGELSKTQIIL